MARTSPKSTRIKRRPLKFNSPQVCNSASNPARKPDPSAICPKCKVYVNWDGGVVCGACDAYWHLNCAGVTDEILARDWKDIEYLCDQHRKTDKTDNALILTRRNEVVLPEMVEDDKGETNIKQQTMYKTVDMVVSTIKVHSYTLNVKSKLKNKLKSIDGELIVEENDRGRQYTLRLNSVTYQLIVDNMTSLGSLLGGVEIKRDDTDNRGANVQTQFVIQIATDIYASVTCYHTTNNVLVQLMAVRTTDSGLETKITKLRRFIKVNFVSLVKMIENMGR